MFGRKGRQARRIAELEEYNARLLVLVDELRKGNAKPEPRPYVVWDPRTEPRPAQGESELTDTEGRVVPCPSCGQPHGDGGVCGTDIKEAA